MTEASRKSYAKAKGSKFKVDGIIVRRLMFEVDSSKKEPEATVSELVKHYTQGALLEANEGTRVSQGFYRTLHDWHKEGLVEIVGERINPETGSPNTIYRLLNGREVEFDADNSKSYKAKYEALTKEHEELKNKCFIQCATIDRQAETIEQLRARIGELTDHINKLTH